MVEPITGVILIDAALAGEWDVFWNALSHLVLPASLLGYFSLAYIARMTRSFMLEQLRPGIRHDGAGQGRAGVARRLAARARQHRGAADHGRSALAYAGLLEGSVLTETVFAWPGLGLYITNSLLNADMNAVLGGTIVVGSVFIGLNLLSDLLYRLLRPEGAHERRPASAAAWRAGC